CQAVNGGTCKEIGDTCTPGGIGANACCSGLCSGGKCVNGSFCRQNRDVCVSNDQCCGGKCTIPAGQLAGTCGDISISGIGSCVVAGTVTPCTGITSSGYGCESSC